MIGFQPLKNKLDLILATQMGRLLFMFLIAIFAAVMVFGLIIYAFLRPPAKKVDKSFSNNSFTISTTPTVTSQTDIKSFLAAVDRNNKLLEANKFEALYNNFSQGLKQNVSYQTFNSLLLAKFGADFRIISSRRATDPVFIDNSAKVDTIITYQVGQNIKQIRNTDFYIYENGAWRISLIR